MLQGAIRSQLESRLATRLSTTMRNEAAEAAAAAIIPPRTYASPEEQRAAEALAFERANPGLFYSPEVFAELQGVATSCFEILAAEDAAAVAAGRTGAVAAPAARSWDGSIANLGAFIQVCGRSVYV